MNELTENQKNKLNFLCLAYYDLFSNQIINPLKRKPNIRQMEQWIKDYDKKNKGWKELY